jgi:hypothetical protein
MPPPKELVDLLGKFGLDKRSITKIRFGGVVGKMALVGVAGLLGLIVVTTRAPHEGLLLWGCLAGILFLAILVVTAIGIHGHQHPLEATLEGGEIVVMQHLKREVEAKGTGEFSASAPILEGIGKKRITEAKES